MTITLQDIRKASELISSQVAHTPCSYSRKLSEMMGAKVILKFENLQFVGAFKERGALVKLLSLTPEQRQKGAIAMSAGNHAQAVAYQAQRLGIPAVIVMPHFTPNAKVERTRSFGAEVILHGEIIDETFGLAQQIAQERQLCIVPPYDDEKIITGQGTIALEMLAAYPDLQVLVVPVGGGGLISGNAIAAKSLNPNIKIVGVQTARFPSMLQALEGKPTTCGGSTIADGIAIKAPGKLTLPIVEKLVDKILLVDEGD
ncbi:MAG TPA: threonine ammonia-lyase, partial [Cyanobacteria bacterium UBA11369]|nr:threonine ammonia-lyase [Cyanobacteria bacterium UBA11369]